MSSVEKALYSVILVDDNEIDNLINRKIIENTGLAKHVLVHTGARSALEFLENISKIAESNRELVPTYVVLDIDMPIMDGFQFLEDVEKLPEPVRSDLKVIMLTSSLSPYDLSKAKKNPRVIRFFNKPLTVQNITDLKNDLIGK